MKMMKLEEVNKYTSERCGQGTVHNAGIKTREVVHRMGTEIKEKPPKILAKTRKKFGKKRAEKQKVAIMLNKARRAGARIPQSH